MPNESPLPKLTALLADGDPAQYAAMRAYSREQNVVEVCAVACTADRVEELLAAGLRPQVLVLDALLPGRGTFWLLEEMRRMKPAYQPVVLVSGAPCESSDMDKFLTSGANYIIVKPYTMPDLFDTICTYGYSKIDAQKYRIHTCLRASLRELQVGPRFCGAQYLEQMLFRLTETHWTGTMSELYEYVAANEHLSTEAIASGLHRLSAAMCARDTDLYKKLRARSGQTGSCCLSNSQLLWGIADHICVRLHM